MSICGKLYFFMISCIKVHSVCFHFPVNGSKCEVGKWQFCVQ